MHLLTGLVAAFIATAVLVLVVVDTTRAIRRKRRAMRTLDAFRDVTTTSVRERELAVPLRERVLRPALERLADFGQSFTPDGVVQRLDDTLVHAGITGWDGPRLLAVKIVTTLVGAFVGFTIVPSVSLVASLVQGGGAAGGAGEQVVQSLIFGLFGGATGYYLPEWIVRSRVTVRSTDIQKALPDALDLLSISVSAGLGFEAAMDRVAREMRGELGIELYRTVQEMRLGQGRAEALRGLAARTDVPELHSFVVSMVQAEAFGVPIARVLTTQADEIRLKRRQRAEQTAQKIPVKILFPLIVCIFPVLFIVILGPAAITIFENVLSNGTP